jgi:hypothetical protein
MGSRFKLTSTLLSEAPFEPGCQSVAGTVGSAGVSPASVQRSCTEPPLTTHFQRDAAETAALPIITTSDTDRRLISRSTRIVMVSLLALTSFSYACDLPVFRWALENWGADPYEFVVYHDGELDDGQKAIIGQLRAGTTEEGGLGNGTTTLVDTSKPMDAFFEELWNNQESPQLPWMVVRYPHALPNPSYVWSATLTAENIATLLNSPARREIVKRLGEETTAVWVFLKTGDVKRDAGRLESLEAGLKAMGKTIEIVPLDIEANEEAEPVAWDLQFSTLAIDRNDPSEQPFIQMLLKSEGDLNGTDAPMAFPVFARGRALYALVDGGIAPDLVEEACMYIAGRCTCEVKDLNPGIDLLISADWDAVVGESMMAPIEPPSVAGLTAIVEEPMPDAEDTAAADNVAAEAPPVPASSNAPSRSMVINIAIAMAVGFLLVIVGTAYILIKTPNRNT